MSCPHSSQAGPCSSCLSAPAKVVEIADGSVYVDGVDTGRRSLAENPNRKYYRRGGKR
jgi:hypothetical protein